MARNSALRFASFLAPNMAPVYRFLAARLADRLASPVELVVGSSFSDFERGTADLGVICGLPYVWLAEQRPSPVEPLVAPVLAGARYQDRPIYFSDVIVAADSPARSLPDLKGCTWAYNDSASHSGYTVTLYELVRAGLWPGFFGQVVAAGFHERSIRLVATGQVDAAAIDSQVLAVALRDDPEVAARVRVVASFGPSTIQPVVAATRLPAPVRAAVREALCSLAGDPSAADALAHGFIERFAPVDDATYDDIRSMLATIRSAGATTLE